MNNQNASVNVVLFGETELYKLDSVTWTKPGKTVVVMSSIREGIVGAGFPAAPNIKDYIDIEGIALRLMSVSQKFEEGVMYCKWNYECGWDNISSPTDRNNDAAARGEQWSMSVDMTQVPLAQHPDASTIMKTYGGSIKGGELVFGRYFNNKKNPYYGVSSFYFPTVTLEVQCITRDPGGGGLSFAQVDEVGRNDASLLSPKGLSSGFSFASNATATVGRKPWILTSHTVKQTGFERLEAKSWRWGGVTGWLDAIYDPDWTYASNSTPTGSPAIPLGAK